MNRIARIAALLLATTASAAWAVPPLVPAQLRAQFSMPWDQPPQEFKEVQRQGFHAGVQAAIHDYDHHRAPEPERSKQFRKPHVSRSLQNEFRDGFARGYNDAYKHLMKSNGRHS